MKEVKSANFHGEVFVETSPFRPVGLSAVNFPDHHTYNYAGPLLNFLFFIDVNMDLAAMAVYSHEGFNVNVLVKSKFNELNT